MAVVTCKKKGLFGLTMPERKEFIAITTGMHDQRQVWWLEQQAESSHCELKALSKERYGKWQGMDH